jgi:hypothetical protein
MSDLSAPTKDGRRLTPAALQSAIKSIVKGNSIRATVRLTGIPQNHVKTILIGVGEACARYHQKSIRNETCGALRCDMTKVLQEKDRWFSEDWAHQATVGSAWTWTAIDPETHFVPSWLIAPLNSEIASSFLAEASTLAKDPIEIADSRGRTIPAFHSNDSGGFSLDHEVLARAFGSSADYFKAVRVCTMGLPHSIGALRIADPWLTIFSGGFRRKVQRHAAAVALFFTYHNFATADAAGSPAMAAGIADHVWDVCEIVGLANGCGRESVRN